MRSGPKEEWTLPAPVPVSPLPEVYLTPYRYYHTLFTHSLPKTLRTLADDTPTCVDVLMNFLVATVTKLPPIKVPYGRQHQEAAPLVREPSGDWSSLGKPGLGKETRGFSLAI